jgi:hypothetical protein
MESLTDRITIVFLGLASAAAAALLLVYIAHYDFGLSRQEIRSEALLGVILIAAALGADLLRRKTTKRK